jgi:hypothetical protein
MTTLKQAYSTTCPVRIADGNPTEFSIHRRDYLSSITLPLIRKKANSINGQMLARTWCTICPGVAAFPMVVVCDIGNPVAVAFEQAGSAGFKMRFVPFNWPGLTTPLPESSRKAANREISQFAADLHNHKWQYAP